MKISIITVTLNNKAGLLRAIESVRSQTYKNVEHIIVDGGSTDGSVEMLKKEVEKIGSYEDKKISPPINRGRNDKDQGDKSLLTTHYSLLTTNYSLLTISEADTGIYDAINKGIKLATGDVIGLLHSDDFYANEFVLERYAEVFTQGARSEAHSDFQNPKPTTNHLPPTTHNQQPTIDAVYSDLVYVRSKTKDEKQKKSNSESVENFALSNEHTVIRRWKTHKVVNREPKKLNNEITTNYTPLTIHHLLNGWMPPHPTLFLRKEVFEKFGLYRTDMKIAADYEMILRLFYKLKITSCYLPITTYCMTIGGASNKSLKNIFLKSSEDYRALRMHRLPFPTKTLLLKNLIKLPQFFRKNS